MRMEAETEAGAARLPEADGEQVRAIKQGVLSDVSCVLARAGGADIDPRHAFHAARNVCEILFGYSHRPSAEIPKLFWDTPLGRAVGVCCGDRDERGDATLVRTTVPLPLALSEKLQAEAERQGKTLPELLAERLAHTV